MTDMKFKTLSPEALKRAFEKDLKSAFPPSELKPLWVMEKLRREGLYEPLGYFDNAGEVQGYLLLGRHRDRRYALIDYLCVPEEKRNNGIGRKMLEDIWSYCPENAVLIVESEAPTGDPEADTLILRRLNFYTRNGAAALGYDCALFGVRYRNFCWAKEPPDAAEVLRKHQEIYRDLFWDERDKPFIQLPLAPGEPVREFIEWMDMEESS